MVLQGMWNSQQNRFHFLIDRELLLESNLIGFGAIAKTYAEVVERVNLGSIKQLNRVS